PGVDDQAADDAVGRGCDDRKGQRIVFYITAGQSDRFGRAGRRADTSGVGDRSVVDRRDRDRNGGDGAGQRAVINLEGEAVPAVEIRVRRVGQVGRGAAQDAVRREVDDREV